MIEAPEGEPEDTRNGNNPSSVRTFIGGDGVERPYHSVTISGGTDCDLTGKQRETEIRYICEKDSANLIHSIEETSTCKYLLIVYTNLICENPVYQRDKEPTEDITCVTDPATRLEGLADETRPSADLEVHAERDRLLGEEKRKKKLKKEQLEQQAQKRSAQKDVARKHEIKAQEAAAKRRDASASTKEKSQQNLALTASEVENRVKMARQVLSKFIKGTMCFTGGNPNAWWQFEVCYGKHVIQFHREKEGQRTEVVLGKWDKSYHVAKIAAEKSAVKKGFSLYFKDGQFCEEVNRNRDVRVIMKCVKAKNPRDASAAAVSLSLSEEPTCSYKLNVESPLICDLLPNLDKDGLPSI